MGKVIIFTVLCVLYALCNSAATMAYDDLISNDTGVLKLKGGLSGRASIINTTANKYWMPQRTLLGVSYKDMDVDPSYKTRRIPLRVNYGLSDQLTVFGVIPVLTKWDQGDYGESGIGDIWLGAKFAKLEVPHGISSIRVALDIPAGDDKKNLGNSGGFGIDAAFMNTSKFSNVELNGQVGLRWNAENTETKYAPSMGTYLDVECSFSFVEALRGQFGAQYMNFPYAKIYGENWWAKRKSVELYGGITCIGIKNIGLRGDIIYTIMGENELQNTGLVITVGYAVK